MAAADPLLPADPAHLLRETLLNGLRQGRWGAGERLPTERVLCERFGVGRTALRRVLREFKERGLIRQTVGSGTYVTDAVAEQLPAAAVGVAMVSPAELMQARLLIEPLLVDLVVRQATPADFEHMEACCREAEAATTLEGFEHWDGALHASIARATHNAFFQSVFALMTQARQRGEWGLLKKKSVTPERRQRYEGEHRALVAALKNRDAEGARALVVAHLQSIERNLFGQ